MFVASPAKCNFVLKIFRSVNEVNHTDCALKHHYKSEEISTSFKDMSLIEMDDLAEPMQDARLVGIVT